ncbi:MAG: SLBB domain-containing protein [Syntrophotaleaceae bacterium]
MQCFLIGMAVLTGFGSAMAEPAAMGAGGTGATSISGGTTGTATLSPMQMDASGPVQTGPALSPEIGAQPSAADAGPESADLQQAEIDVEQIFQDSGDEAFKSSVSGRMDLNLKRFGFSFFHNRARLQPDPLALVGPDYVVGPGDTLRIDVWGNIEGNYSVTVDRNGEITLPKVGVINLWGQTFSEAKQTIKTQVSKYFKNFEMNVTMGSLRSIQVFMVGEVAAPGSYQLSSLSTLLTALSAAGGPSGRGSLRKVQVLRQGALLTEFDFYDFFLSGDKNRDVRLQAGDTIFVPMSGPLVGIAGNVRRPAVYELKGGETLSDCLALAGGVNPTAYLNKVQIERIQAHRQRLVLDLDLGSVEQKEAAALTFPMQDRDLVKVSPIAMAGGFVSLQGYVVRPGKYELTKGMRLADLLIPYDNLLPEFYPHAAQIIHRLPPEYRPEIVTVDLQQALEGNPEHNLVLQEYDEVRVFSRAEMEEMPEVSIAGAVLKSGTYRLFDKMTVKDLVTVAGSLKRGAFLDQAEITRYIPSATGTRVERFNINLEKALSGHPQHNLLLQPEDHLVVRSIPDYGERMRVVVKGEVLFPGIYAISKGETLSSVLERAGGYTGEAYLRGAIFTRESIKDTQRQHVQKLIDEQERQIAKVSQEMAAGAMTPEEAKAAQTTIASQQALLDKLRNTPVTGRLVVQLKPIGQLKESADNVALMSGDEIYIPKDPQTVNVQGMVYNPAALTWKPGKNANYYLSKVGGPKEDAKTEEMFIVRADGTVVSQQQAGIGISWDSDNWRWTFGGLQSTRIYPGDSILVPEDFEEKTDWMKEFKDLSTIIYQMALGAAAVASF